MGDQKTLIHDEQNISTEDLAELLAGAGEPEPQREKPSDLEVAVGGGLEECTIPVIIGLQNGREFHVDDLRAWAWTPFGVYGVGYYGDDEEKVERNVLFSGREVSSIELQAEAYENYVKQANEESESSSD